MNSYATATQIINGSIDTNFDDMEIDIKGLKSSKENNVEEVDEKESIKAAMKILNVLKKRG